MSGTRQRLCGGCSVPMARTWLVVAIALLLSVSCGTSAEVTNPPDPTAVPPVTPSPTAVPVTAVAEAEQPTTLEPETGPTRTRPTTAPAEPAPTEPPVPTSTPPTPTPPTPTPPTPTPVTVRGDRWAPRKVLVDLDEAAAAREIASLEAQRGPDQVLVITKDTSCGVLDAEATPMPDTVLVELFFDERIQCVRAVESHVLFVIDAAGTNSHGSWNYRSAPSVNVVRTGVDERSAESPVPSVERVVPSSAGAGIVAATVLTDPDPGDTQDVLAVLEAAKSSGARIVVANFQGCMLIEAAAVPMPTQVVVQATFDPSVDCFRAFNYQAFFVIESSGVNIHGAWNYAQQPKVTVEYLDQS